MPIGFDAKRMRTFLVPLDNNGHPIDLVAAAEVMATHGYRTVYMDADVSGDHEDHDEGNAVHAQCVAPSQASVCSYCTVLYSRFHLARFT